jgi:hypothetical protein
MSDIAVLNCYEGLAGRHRRPASGLAVSAAEGIMSDEDARRPTHGTLAVDAGDAGDAAAAADASPQALLDMMRRLRARERAYLASLLHDGPIQELAAVALELGEVRPPPTEPTEPTQPTEPTRPTEPTAPTRSTEPTQLTAPTEPTGLVRQVHAIGRTLCRLQDELWPFPRPGSGLIEILKQRTAWLLSTSLAVAVGEGVAELPESDVQAVADVTELILAGLGNAEAWDRPIVAVRADPDLIFLELNMTPAPWRDPASGGAAAAGAAAVGAWLHRLAAAIKARADVGLDDRRLRIWMEIPRDPDRRPPARAQA